MSPVPEMWTRGYCRISDNSSSRYGGHATEADAMKDALSCHASPDICCAWVVDPDGEVVWWRGHDPRVPGHPVTFITMTPRGMRGSVYQAADAESAAHLAERDGYEILDVQENILVIPDD